MASSDSVSRKHSTLVEGSAKILPYGWNSIFANYFEIYGMRCLACGMKIKVLSGKKLSMSNVVAGLSGFQAYW